MKRIVFSLAAFALLAAAGSTQAGTITVTAGYDAIFTDNTTMTITNNTGTTLTGISLTGLGISGSINGVTGTKTFADLAAGASVTVPFDSTATSGNGAVFHADFDDFFTGAVQYTLTGFLSGQKGTGTFSPATN